MKKTHKFVISQSALVIVLGWIMVASALAATVIHVPADQPTIQAGIDAAVNGDTVLVSPGTYVENINFNGKAIAVASSQGPKLTTIDGNKVAPVASFTSQEGLNSVLKGFTLKNGVAQGFPDGGGIAIYSSSPRIIQNIIKGNSGGSGGGIGVNFGSPVISTNVISNNNASSGGGVYVGGDSTAKITDNTIENNTAYYFGGGINLFAAGSAIVQNNRIIGNQSSTQGGGVYIVNEANATFVQNLIVRNQSSQGGGVYFSVPVSSRGLLFVNNTIASNKGQNGSGVWAGGFDDNDVLVNNLIIGTAGGTAVVCDTTYNPNPPVFKFNDAFAAGGIGFQGSCAGDVGRNGNISVDPRFVNPGILDYQLLSDSPALDAGSNAAPRLPAQDLLGNPRIVDGDGDGTATVDMGTYEFQ